MTTSRLWRRRLRTLAAGLCALALCLAPAAAAAKKDNDKKPAAPQKKAEPKKAAPKKADAKKAPAPAKKPEAKKPAAKKDTPKSSSSKKSSTPSTKSASKPAAVDAWVPPGFDETEAAEWKKGGSPGWGFGDGDSWNGQIPAALADRKPPDWDTWNEDQRAAWLKALEEAKQKVMDGRGALSEKDAKRIAASLEMAARQGAPVSTVLSCVTKGMEKGLTAFEMERLTRAFASAARANVDIYTLSQHAESLVGQGTRGVNLARGVYLRIKSLGA